MKRENVLAEIEKEFSTARLALTERNEGKARVCARRAAGKAVAWFLAGSPRPAWGNDAMTQLRALSADGSFPDAVRTAALRLTTKIDPQFSYPAPVAAIDDAQTIVYHFLVNAGDRDVR
jgi:hypothetical protein